MIPTDSKGNWVGTPISAIDWHSQGYRSVYGYDKQGNMVCHIKRTLRTKTWTCSLSGWLWDNGCVYKAFATLQLAMAAVELAIEHNNKTDGIE